MTLGEKWCPHCQQWKDLEEFGVHHDRVDGRQPWCRSCVNKHGKEHGHGKTSNRNRRLIVQERKKWRGACAVQNSACLDYHLLGGVQAYPGLYDFDHLPDKPKRFEAGGWVNYTLPGRKGRLPAVWRTVEALDEELENCQLVCSPCHEELPSSRRGSLAPRGYQNPTELRAS